VSGRRYRLHVEPLFLLGISAESADGRGDRPGALFAHMAAGMAPPSRPLIVCLSSTDWGFLRYRKLQLMEQLSGRADVVYVNPPRGALREPSDNRETAA
jgi:hypothetical protein